MTDVKTPLILALDVGTSSTRALLFDANGATVPDKVAQQKYTLTTSNTGQVTVDADELTKVVAQTITDILQQAGPLAQHIAAVAMDTFWHSLLGVDTAGRPVTPVITWEDTRPFSAALELRTQLDEKAVHDRTGARFHASYWPAKLRWLAKTQPETFERASQWISFGEYLHRTFLGHAICSLSMASATGMLNARSQQWDTELIQILGVHAEQMPQLGDMQESIHGLTPEYASAWPALKDLPWFPALGDGAAACIGSGCASTENWSVTMGTSSAMRVVVPPHQVVPPLGLWMYLIDSKHAVLGGAMSEGGNLLNWLCDDLKLPAWKEAEPLVKKLAPDEHGITMLPFLSGERSLGWHADARMTIAGISIHTQPAEILRAGMEALAYRLAAIYRELCAVLQQPSATFKMIASGGILINSAVLRDILADTLGIAVYPSREHEASARGAALLALAALGVIPDVYKVAPTLQEATQPDDKTGSIYRKAAERQEKLYHALLPD